ncbi:heat shock protein Hsp90 family protein [Kipferlia bialata]|uniref:Heat shock protein Hsp90 family protein n=2 Tax=Kipferlia bialata TaxID=797122 RepID=A0A391NN58_9EUKA|nr:heat shock protein Hsp90 family protein [Kipferlia bialata]|eukprot:g7835.t1
MQCISKDGLDLELTDAEKEEMETLKSTFAALCKHIKDTLGESIEAVKVSFRLTGSPCVLTTSEWGWSAQMQKIMKAQALADDSFSSIMVSKKTLEINPKNSIVKHLQELLESDPSNESIADVVSLLYDTALLSSGFTLENPSKYVARIHAMMRMGLEIEDEEEEEHGPETEAALEEEESEDSVADID